MKSTLALSTINYSIAEIVHSFSIDNSKKKHSHAASLSLSLSLFLFLSFSSKKTLLYIQPKKGIFIQFISFIFPCVQRLVVQFNLLLSSSTSVVVASNSC